MNIIWKIKLTNKIKRAIMNFKMIRIFNVISIWKIKLIRKFNVNTIKKINLLSTNNIQ